MSRGSMQRCLLVAVLISAAALAQAAGRSLQQDASLSNSNGCLGTIPKCEAGACATRNVMGTARWVCLRCLSNFEPVVTADGQDNIIQCVCPKGFYLNGTDATSCARCEANDYCPGGDKVENPANLGALQDCGAGLVTRNTGARSQIDCVAPAGYAMTSPTSATPCNPSEYAPKFNRLAKCLRCQSGLEENPASGLLDGDRSSKRTVCKVPPGRYMSQGLVRICAQGFYRADYVDFDAEVAQKCVACNPGITTSGAGAKSAAECNQVLAGYGVSNVFNVSSDLHNLPALPQNDTTGLPAASVCELGFYSAGGYRVACPSGTVTRVKGAQAVEECVVPPGYWLPASGAMTKCTSSALAGSFREGWVMFSDPRAKDCSSCGDGILSEPRDLDENPLAPNNTFVMSTPTSCYIEPGQGMFAVARNTFAAKDCPVNSYGVSGRVYGWIAAPCKPCPRNMITNNVSRVNNSDACINDDGFGYASEGASRCAPGFYSAKGSRKPCQRCPQGRTTADNPALQRAVTDCFVMPGFGVVNTTSNATDPYNPTTDGGMLPVLDCPVGYYGGGGSIDSKCLQCPAGSTTAATGAVNATQCQICIAGWGQASTGSACRPCDYGSFQPGGNPTCDTCPDTTFYGPVDGQGAAVTVGGTTLYTGSQTVEACVPKKSQMAPEAGQAYFTTRTPDTVAPTVTTADLATCLATCDAVPNTCCLAQFSAGACRTATMTPQAASIAAPQYVFKLPPSGLAASVASMATDAAPAAVTDAASIAIDGAPSVTSEEPAVKAKSLASGYYAHCAIPVDGAAADIDWLTVGSPLQANAQVFRPLTAPAIWDEVTSTAQCKQKCDDSNICIGFITRVSDDTKLQCSYRGGVDTPGSRAFFALPAPSATTNIQDFGW